MNEEASSAEHKRLKGFPVRRGETVSHLVSRRPMMYYMTNQEWELRPSKAHIRFFQTKSQLVSVGSAPFQIARGGLLIRSS